LAGKSTILAGKSNISAGKACILAGKRPFGTETGTFWRENGTFWQESFFAFSHREFRYGIFEVPKFWSQICWGRCCEQMQNQSKIKVLPNLALF
jgi:hypothetical protein